MMCNCNKVQSGSSNCDSLRAIFNAAQATLTAAQIAHTTALVALALCEAANPPPAAAGEGEVGTVGTAQ